MKAWLRILCKVIGQLLVGFGCIYMLRMHYFNDSRDIFIFMTFWTAGFVIHDLYYLLDERWVFDGKKEIHN